MDNSERMVQYGSNLAREHGVKNLEYRVGELESLPLKNASVDMAFFSQSLHHAQHPERAIGEAWRILKPGGRVLILDLVRHHFERGARLVRRRLAGFQ